MKESTVFAVLGAAIVILLALLLLNVHHVDPWR